MYIFKLYINILCVFLVSTPIALNLKIHALCNGIYVYVLLLKLEACRLTVNKIIV